MEVSRKRARAGSRSIEDMLSALPDVLLHSIFSFLKARQVVQTSVLSRRWRHLWRSVPCLDIDQREFISGVEGHGISQNEREKFEDFTDNLLTQRNGLLLDTFVLHVDAREPYRTDAGRWIRRGIKCSPKVLHIHSDGWGYKRPELPSEFGSSLRRLTKLYLFNVSLKSSFPEQINSVCTALEDLELKDCQFGFDKIVSPSLRNLIISNGCTQSGSPCDQLIIKTPCLDYLYLNLHPRKFRISVDEMPYLLEASIHVDFYYTNEIIHINQWKFLSNLFNATNLELSGLHMLVVPEEESFEFPTFQNLRTLLLDKCELGDKFELLRRILKKSPNLEKLTVQCCKFSNGSKRGKGKAKSTKISLQRHGLEDFRCRKLKHTEIMYEDVDNVRQLVNVLLDISRCRSKNTITLTNVGRADESGSESD